MNIPKWVVSAFYVLMAISGLLIVINWTLRLLCWALEVFKRATS